MKVDNDNIRRSDFAGGRQSRLQVAPFIAWDGEGYTDGNGEHHYMLFGNRTEYIASDTGRSLHYEDCFSLLLDTAAKGPANHVIFGGDYDIIMMTGDMPFNVKDRLLKGMPVRYAGYRMQWFRRKYFQLSDGKRSIMLYDVVSFFQTTFVKACIEYLGNDDTLTDMAVMKARRNTFRYDMLDSDVIPYWNTELEYLERLMYVLRSLMAEVNIFPRGWYGPGAVASAILKSHRIDDEHVEFSDAITDAAERAFYGGRFEQFFVGLVNGAHEYDIRSAYPKAITLLPSYKDVEWTHIDRPTDEVLSNPYALIHLRWNWFNKPADIVRPGPLPWRNANGNVYYPLIGEGFYWAIEAANIRECAGCQYEIVEAFVPSWPRERRYPFSFVQQMYDDRARMKEEGNPAQRALKLGMNSLYGKLAQSKGAKRTRTDEGEYLWTKPRWHQITWAGWITAYCRRRIWGAIVEAIATGVEVIAVETDAIFTTKPLSYSPSSALGAWDHLQLDELLYIQSGVYCSKENGKWSFKSRGTEGTQAFSAEKWLDICAKLPHSEINVTVKLNRFGTVLRSKTYGRWFQMEKSTKLPALSSKRVHHAKLCKICLTHKGASFVDGLHHLVVPQPILTSDAVGSVPYKFPWRTDGARWNREVSIMLETEPEMELS